MLLVGKHRGRENSRHREIPNGAANESIELDVGVKADSKEPTGLRLISKAAPFRKPESK